MFPRLAALTLLVISASNGQVSFTRDIAPLLQRRCAGCHGEESAKGEYRLDTFSRLQRTGASELPPLVVGKPVESELYRLLLESDASDRMPQKADALPAEELTLIERWIAAGAAYDGGSPDRPLVELARGGHLRAAPATYARPLPITAMAWSPDGVEIATSGYCEVLVWDACSGALRRRIGGMPERITGLSWHPEGGLLAVSGGTPGQWGTVALVDVAGSGPVHFLCDLPETAQAVAFSPDGKRLLAGAGDRTTRLWQMPSRKPLQTMRQHADWVQAVGWSADGRHCFTAGRDRAVRVLTREGELETTYLEHDVAVLGAAFSPDGSRMLSLGRDGTVQTWERGSGKRLGKQEPGGRGWQAIAAWGEGWLGAAADGRMVAGEWGKGPAGMPMAGHLEPARVISGSPDGERIATGSADGEIFVWTRGGETWLQRWRAWVR